ncbi:MAG: MutS protein msh4 [Cirrosporium novae-zelandiae]|nr:MAG: MutS protein msh4 [Cirrosporium novae-zelandiae]
MTSGSRSSQSTPSNLYCSASIAYPEYEYTTTNSRPMTGQRRSRRSKSGRARTAASTAGGVSDQTIICAISESRGISPTVGLAFVNLSTTEAVLCQICDSQSYIKTINKLVFLEPTEILFMSTTANPKSKLYSTVEENIPDVDITVIDRKYWAENTGHEYIQQFAFKKDIESLRISVENNYFAACCFAAALKYIELALSLSFPFHSLRIKFEPSEGSMMIDLSTIQSLELIQNALNAKSRNCLFGLLNETLTPMGARLLKSNILQPSTDSETLKARYDAVLELTEKEDMFSGIRKALTKFLDADRVLAAVIVPTKATVQYAEQSINNVIMLKQYVESIRPIYEALTGAMSGLLKEIRELCAPSRIEEVEELITNTINEETTYQSKPLDLRNQRTYAVKAGANGLLDVSRATYREADDDARQLYSDLCREHELSIDLQYDPARQYYFRIPLVGLADRVIPPVFTNIIRKKTYIECQTLALMKQNQKVLDAHHEVLQLSDAAVQDLISSIQSNVSTLSQTSESIAMLDILASFAHLATFDSYVRPELTSTLAIKSGRHPVYVKAHKDVKYIPNDAYATQQSRFQIVTGCNMSGKSTYIRSIALNSILAQIGCFIPAEYASFPLSHQLFARVSSDSNIEANVSSFAAEMRETAFILRNISHRSLVIIDELGRGTSTRDGLAIAIAIAEALIESHALVWFATHFRDLARVLAERSGVVSLHLEVDLRLEEKAMTMLYRVADGVVEETQYGLALAKVASLPENVVRTAATVSGKLNELIEKKKKGNRALAVARRRKLIFGLKEQLEQAREGKMEGAVLWNWIKRLQVEFATRLAAIEKDADEDTGMQMGVESSTTETDEVDHGSINSEQDTNEA